MGAWDAIIQNQNDNFLKKKEEADAQAALEKELLLQTIMSKKDFNDQAQVGFWDKIKPWDTANERADALNRQAMALKPGGTEQMANDYYDSEGMTSGARRADKFIDYVTKPMDVEAVKQKYANSYMGQESLNPQVHPDEIYNKYFGGSAVPQSVQQTQPAPLSTQQTELGNNLPSSLKQPDNISSFFDYLKNKQ